MSPYEMMGNPMGYVDPVAPAGYETEEERKKREEAERKRIANEVAQKREVVTYADGSKTEKTTREIPAEQLRNAAVQASNDPTAAATASRQAVTPVAPVSPSYNANIARQESGTRPDIGFHDRNKSTAYGTYGMTSAGYEDARRRDPSLPQDITQASPEQQTQAQNAYTQQNAGYLQNLGIEPTENNLAAAHFLGAQGLSNYLKTGQISEAAARANGGADNVKRIVDQRLSGQSAPASGAAQQRSQPVQPVRPQAQPGPGVAVATGQGVQGTMTTPVSPEQAQAQAQAQAQPTADQFTGQGIRAPGAEPTVQPQASAGYIDQYQANQNDAAALMKLGTDENAPEMLRDRARNRAADLITQQREQAKAQAELATKTPTELARMMADRKKDGSWGKYVLFGALGMTALRDQEASKLGIGTDQVIMGADGKSYLVKVGANGAPIEGFAGETGKALNPQELITVMGYGSAMKNVNQGQEVYKDPSGDVKGSFVLETRPGRQPIYKEVGTGRIATPAESAALSKVGVAGTLEQQRAAQIQKQNLDLQKDWAQASIAILRAEPQAAAEEAGKFNFKHGTNFTPKQFQGMAPQIDPTSGRVMTPQAGVQATTSQAAPAQAAPAQTQAQPGRLQPAVPGPGPTQAAPAPAATPAVPVTAQNPVDIESARKRREAEETSRREIEETVSKEEGKKITEMRIALPKTERATESTLKTLDDLLTHPGFSDVIGVPNVITGIFSPPTTDARNFKQKYEQLKGKTFLAAYETLRGTGSISAAEGLRAETAIAALNDPYISEKEFTRNADIFKGALRNGIDNQRIQVGQEPRYKKFSAEEKAAFQWLQQNPKDPKADAVRLKLERSGN